MRFSLLCLQRVFQVTACMGFALALVTMSSVANAQIRLTPSQSSAVDAAPKATPLSGANAGSTNLNDKNFGSVNPIDANLAKVLQGLFGESRVCPPMDEFQDFDFTLPESTLRARLKESQKTGDHCEAASFAHHLRLKAKTENESIQYAELATTELLLAQDYRSTVIYALRTLSDEQIPLSRHERLRFYTLRALFLASQELGPERDPQWTQYGLGLKAAQSERAELLTFAAFLRDFPTSPFAQEVQSMYAKTVEMFLNRELKIADLLMTRQQYMGAIIRLEALYKNDLIRESPRFPEVMTKVIEAQIEFADEIRNPPWIPIQYKWPDERLRHVFQLEHDAAVDRDALANLLLKKAGQACTYLKANHQVSPPACRP